MRSVKTWIGKTDDSKPTTKAKQRIVERQNGLCALTGREFVPGDKIEFDHIVPLWLNGKNSEDNLQAVIGEAHKRKTKVEAAVRAKVFGAKASHLGLKALKQRIPSRPKREKPARDRIPEYTGRRLLYVPGHISQPLGGTEDHD